MLALYPQLRTTRPTGFQVVSGSKPAETLTRNYLKNATHFGERSNQALCVRNVGVPALHIQLHPTVVGAVGAVSGRVCGTVTIPVVAFTRTFFKRNPVSLLRQFLHVTPMHEGICMT